MYELGSVFKTLTVALAFEENLFEPESIVENITKKGNQFFGRNEYMQPVFIEGNKCTPGQIEIIKVKSSNRHNLWGTVDSN